MKKTFSLRALAKSEGGEYVLGAKDLGTHACYLIYGELAPGEEGRRVRPGAGHEEILIAVSGDLAVSSGGEEQLVREGEAMHLQEEETWYLTNPSSEPAVYIMAGGHSGKPH